MRTGCAISTTKRDLPGISGLKRCACSQPTRGSFGIGRHLPLHRVEIDGQLVGCGLHLAS